MSQAETQGAPRSTDHAQHAAPPLSLVDGPTRPHTDFAPDFAISLEEANRRVEMLREFVRGHMVEGEDYGVIPGASPKPTLFKPGAEKLNAIFGLAPIVEIDNRVEDWAKGFISYVVKVTLLNKRDGAIEAEGIGACNSQERKYKSQDAANVANTILKMAKKRALIDATLSATRASGIFTQDVEDGNFGGQSRAPQRSQSQAPQGHNNGQHGGHSNAANAPANGQKWGIPVGTKPSACRTCREEVFWIETKAGKKMPVNGDGTSHFSTCPQAAQHRSTAQAQPSPQPQPQSAPDAASEPGRTPSPAPAPAPKQSATRGDWDEDGVMRCKCGLEAQHRTGKSGAGWMCAHYETGVAPCDFRRLDAPDQAQAAQAQSAPPRSSKAPTKTPKPVEVLSVEVVGSAEYRDFLEAVEEKGLEWNSFAAGERFCAAFTKLTDEFVTLEDLTRDDWQEAAMRLRDGSLTW